MTADTATLRERLRALFLDELDDNLVVLNRGLLALEEGAGARLPADEVQSLFRAAHSLKGAAHSAAVTSVVAVCTRLEEVFAGLRDGTVEADATTLAELFAGVDALAEEGRLLCEGSRGPTDEAPAAQPLTAVPRPVDRPFAGEEPSPSAPGERPAAGAVRVQASKLDSLLNQAGELRSSSARLELLVGRAAAWSEAGDIERLTGAVTAAGHSLRQAMGTLTQTAQELRMQPFGQVCEGLDRVVRDLANGARKHARLLVDGSDVELDRAVAAALREPLLHLLRNAVDHGIESPEARAAAGKPAAGSIRLSAALRDGGLTVTVADDGGGVDVQALRAAAEERRETAALDDAELVFVPGLSTARTLSDVSGRGVGLDAVRARVERLGGTVHVTTEAGSGTAVSLSVPLTLSTFRAVLVSCAGETLALPLAAVERLTRVQAGDVHHAEGRIFTVLDGATVPVVPLSQALGFSGPEPVAPDHRLDAAVVASGPSTALLLVDTLLGEGEIVMKSLPERVATAPAVLGATILASGQVGLVLNPAACVRLASSRAARLPVERSASPATAHRVLIAEDTLTTRVLERTILEAAGYDVAVAVDGADAWQQLQEQGADLVVSDVDMPRMDGFSLCRAIRSSGRFRELPVVLVTSLAGDRDRARGMEVGASAYLVKSAFEQGALLDTIERLL